MPFITEFEPVQTVNGGFPSTLGFRQDDNETFVQGQCLITTDATGFVAEAADGQADVLGISGGDADNDTENVIVPVYVLDHNTIFRAVATTPANVTVARIFDLVDLNRTPDTAAGVHTADENASADDVFYVTDISAVGGQLYVKAGGGSQFVGVATYVLT